jgi:hypothetical protein
VTNTLDLGGLLATSVRLVTPWSGARWAEVDVDLESAEAPAPAGRSVLRIGLESFVVRIDPRGTHKKGAKATVRVIAGGGGWDAPVRRQHFQSDAGVLVASVLAATAAEVGETVLPGLAGRLGTSYVRTAGPASRVLAGRDWYVNAAGVTVVASWPELPAVADLEVLDWDPITRAATIAADAVISPGLVLTDARFGRQVVRDVEQTFDAKGSRAHAWCATDPRSKLAGTFAHAVREVAGVSHLRNYRYRVATMSGTTRANLQATDPAAGAPDLFPVPLSYGLPGATFVHAPGQEATVGFVDGDPSRPVVLGYEAGTVPVSGALAAVAELNLDAVRVSVGAGAALVALSPGVIASLNALVAAAPAQAAAVNSLQSQIAAVASALAAVAAIAPLLPAHVAAAAAATTAASAGAAASAAGAAATAAASAAISGAVAGIPSTKLWSV